MQKKFLIGLIAVFIILPFALVANHPTEIVTHVLPMWIWYGPTVLNWIGSGKPLWQTVLATYSVTALGIIVFYYLGTGLLQTSCRLALAHLCKNRVFAKWFYRFKNDSLLLKKGLLNGKKMSSMGANFSSRKEKISKRLFSWLSRQSFWLILIVYIVPLPLTGAIPVMIIKLKKIKYGLWWLLGANIISVLIVLWSMYAKIKF